MPWVLTWVLLTTGFQHYLRYRQYPGSGSTRYILYATLRCALYTHTLFPGWHLPGTRTCRTPAAHSHPWAYAHTGRCTCGVFVPVATRYSPPHPGDPTPSTNVTTLTGSTRDVPGCPRGQHEHPATLRTTYAGFYCEPSLLFLVGSYRIVGLLVSVYRCIRTSFGGYILPALLPLCIPFGALDCACWMT